MIPTAFLQAWSTKAPWPDLRQVEQDLIICRALCDLFNAPALTGKMRWAAKTTGKSGYAPACANEWRTGVCEKPRIKCGDCRNRSLIPLSDAVIYAHLAGDHTIGVYPLLDDDSCHFLAIDFDEAEWREDVRAFADSCTDLGVPVAIETSRSGKGAHAWIFFAERVSARDARRLGTAIISHTCARTRQLKLTSYDRLFPSQDTMPKGGFGNLIALRCRGSRGKTASPCSSIPICGRIQTSGNSWHPFSRSVVTERWATRFAQTLVPKELSRPNSRSVEHF